MKGITIVQEQTQFPNRSLETNVTGKQKTLATKLHDFGANVITNSIDSVPHPVRVRNDRLARSTILAPKNAWEKRELSKVLAGPERMLFEIDKSVGFTSFSWPKEHLPLVRKAIANTQEASRTDTWSGKSYFRSLRSMADYSLDSPEFRLATSPEMLKSVSNYLGKLPMLLDISARISLSDPDKPGDKLSGSQMFHRDMDDVASVKVWILCSEVKKENGPTVLLPISTSHEVAGTIGYRQGDKIPNDEPFKNVKGELFEAVGPVGTSFATDTCSSFHYGSRVQKSKERLVLYFQYVSSTSVYFRPLGERAGNRSRKFFTVSNPETLTESQRVLLRGYLP